MYTMGVQFAYRLEIHLIAFGLLVTILLWQFGIKETLTAKREISLDVFSRSLESDHETRIVGGVPVEPGEFPFFVYPVGMMLCGATLIYPE